MKPGRPRICCRGQEEDILIEYPLGRLQDRSAGFIVPSAALSDIQALKAQIELRRRALRDIEVIRSRLRLSEAAQQ